MIYGELEHAPDNAPEQQRMLQMDYFKVSKDVLGDEQNYLWLIIDGLLPWAPTLSPRQKIELSVQISVAHPPARRPPARPKPNLTKHKEIL